MMLRLLPILFLFAGWPLFSSAFLPPAAEYRVKEVLDYRERKKTEYERMQTAHEGEMVASQIRVKALMENPRWPDFPESQMGSVGLAGIDERLFKKKNNNRRWSLSAMALIFVAAFAFATRHLVGDSADS